MAVDKTELLNDLLVRVGQLQLEVADAKESGSAWQEKQDLAYFLYLCHTVISFDRTDTWTDAQFEIVEDRLRRAGGLDKVGQYSLNDLTIPFATLSDDIFTETDPTVPTHVKQILTTDIIEWDAAHTHTSDTDNPHSVTKTQVGLGNADNTADIDKPVSTSQAAADAAIQAFSIQRANHTGTQTASTISDFDTEVANNSAVAANTAKVSNATHTGDVTGDTALTIANDAVTNAKAANMAQNTIKGRVTASTGDPEDLTATQVRSIINVEDGATANSSDADLLNRANHTGTQAQSTIVDLETDLSGKYDKSGGTISGDVSLEKAAPNLDLVDSGSTRHWRFRQHVDKLYFQSSTNSYGTSSNILTFEDGIATFYARVKGFDATESDDFVTKSQLDAVGSGASDHGALTGLSDDDHTQYHTDARALTWLGTRSTTDLSEGSNLYYTTARANAAIDTRVDKAFVDALNVDADTLDGVDSGSFIRSDADDTVSANTTWEDDNKIYLGTSSTKRSFIATYFSTGNTVFTKESGGDLYINNETEGGDILLLTTPSGGGASSSIYIRGDLGVSLLHQSTQCFSTTSNGIKIGNGGLNTAPSSSSDTGEVGAIRFANDYIYVCTSVNTWKRAAISTW
ncbi:hypothetical protein AWW68_19565 [Roseivirga spongicola]|uniref:Uncharacterized protein n=1 Tax=Roseivirga spongicola TaxID=333140 RepID=A0A150XCC8_9BACT|nr:hypothetical protein [Roseivirga spongicola]KYG76389.1 hypothetical protein AWW68_19565 [Roseivirga spongicola]